MESLKTFDQAKFEAYKLEMEIHMNQEKVKNGQYLNAMAKALTDTRLKEARLKDAMEQMTQKCNGLSNELNKLKLENVRLKALKTSYRVTYHSLRNRLQSKYQIPYHFTYTYH